MVTILSLWLPILISAALVFIASSLIHMVLKYHSTDFAKLPEEDGVMAALRPFSIPPGEYIMPHGMDSEVRKEQAFKDKLKAGPVAFLTVFSSNMGMGKSLAQWFGYCLLMGVFAAYIAGRALGPGEPYLEVFRFTGAAAFGAYSLALLQDSIWYKRSWSSTLKSLLDGLVYALLTAGTFGWLWPAS